MRKGKAVLRPHFIRPDLPAEALPKVPILEMVGNKRVLIEHHCGVIAFSTCEISVRTDCGIYLVRGNRLEIAKMTRFHLVIIGNIEAVSCLKRR